MLLQLLLGLSTLPWMVLMQTYYMNFVFNNNRYYNDFESNSKGNISEDGTTKKLLEIESETLEVSSVEHSHGRDISHQHDLIPKTFPLDARSHSSNTDEIVEDVDNSLWPFWPTKSTKKPIKKGTKKPTPTTTKRTTSRTTPKTTPRTTTPRTTTQSRPPVKTKGTTKAPSNQTEDVEEVPEEITTVKAKVVTAKLPTVVPHPDDFFNYPLAKCHEDMDLHEVFGIRLERDRGLSAKVYCNFSNSWGGPWLLMNRMELPVRLHMRQWFFGYVSDDFKDMNINFLGLAHLINNMRIAMLILGQDNQDRLVYNLYDDVVISSFNDLFMLRKAHLIEANTTDLLFISVGEVLYKYSGRNRTCPFQVLGGWWGGLNQYGFCVFPVDRDVERPGYVAIFIKPSPFAINNTALYDHEITTRRPWVTTANVNLMAQAKNNSRIYRRLLQEEFNLNKGIVRDEIHRRKNIYPDIEKNRAQEALNQTDYR